MSNQQTFMPETRERTGKRRSAARRPVEVWYRAKPDLAWHFFREWTRWGRYKDEATAEQVLRQKSTDPHFEYEVRK